MDKKSYLEKLKDPRWQKRRLEILERDEWTCQQCGNKKSPLHVHHRYYIKGKDPWDYSNEMLLTLCEECHEKEVNFRKVQEESLLHTLRGIFLVDDLFDLTVGFHYMPLFCHPKVMASICKWILCNEAIMIELCERWEEKGQYEKKYHHIGITGNILKRSERWQPAGCLKKISPKAKNSPP